MQLYERRPGGSFATVEDIVGYTLRELDEIGLAFGQILSNPLQEQFREPERPRTGLMALADGTHWNPGSGRDLYWYDEAVPTWRTILSVPAGGALGVPDGGTGLSSGNSGGVLAFIAPTVLASSLALSANALVLGGGVGVVPATPVGLGVGTQVLHGNAVGAPAWAPVSLTADVSGVLPFANGGFGFNTAAAGDLFHASALDTSGKLPVGSSGTFVQSVSSMPVYSAYALPTVVGAAGGLLRSDGSNYYQSTTTYPDLVGVNQLLYATGSNAIGSSANLTFDGTTLTWGSAGNTVGRIISSGVTVADFTGVGFTPNVATNVMAMFNNTSTGGLTFNAFSNTTATSVPLSFVAYAGSQVPSVALLRLRARKHNGTTGAVALTDTERVAQFENNTSAIWTILGSGNVGFKTIIAPTASIHLPAGTTAAGTGQLLLEASTLLTIPVAGMIERVTDKVHFTIGTGTSRKEFTLNDSVLNSGSLIEATTNGRLQDAVTTGTGNAVRATSPTFVTPALGTPSSVVLTNATGTAAGLTAGNVTTNANLTGPITSTGNATAVAAQTGTGSTFVMQTLPTLTTPNIGAATGTSVNLTGAGLFGTSVGIGVNPALASLHICTTPATFRSQWLAGQIPGAGNDLFSYLAVNAYYDASGVFTHASGNGRDAFQFIHYAPVGGGYMKMAALTSALVDQAYVSIGTNVGIGTTDQFGSGAGALGIANATTDPTTNPTGGGVVYASAGALKYRGSGGTVTTIANA